MKWEICAQYQLIYDAALVSERCDNRPLETRVTVRTVYYPGIGPILAEFQMGSRLAFVNWINYLIHNI